MKTQVVRVPFSGIPVVFVGEWCVLDGAYVSAETIVCKLVGHTPVDNHHSAMSYRGNFRLAGRF